MLTRATDTLQVLQSCSRGFAATPCSSKSRRLKVHVHVRVGRRGRRVFALFPSDSTFISHRWQFARSFQRVFPPPHSIEKNTTTVLFFSTTEAERDRPDVPSHVIRPHFDWSVVCCGRFVDHGGHGGRFFWIR